MYHLVRRSRASKGAGYRERTRISTETTEDEGFFSMNVLTWNKKNVYFIRQMLVKNKCFPKFKKNILKCVTNKKINAVFSVNKRHPPCSH